MILFKNINPKKTFDARLNVRSYLTLCQSLFKNLWNMLKFKIKQMGFYVFNKVLLPYYLVKKIKVDPIGDLFIIKPPYV